jgi:hypothetical protein
MLRGHSEGAQLRLRRRPRALERRATLASIGVLERGGVLRHIRFRARGSLALQSQSDRFKFFTVHR